MTETPLPAGAFFLRAAFVSESKADYSQAMKKLLICLLFVSPLVDAALYKWKDADGNIHYTDRKPVETEQVEKVPDYLLKAGGQDPLNPASVYEQFEISSPQPDEIIRSQGDSVDIAVSVTPPLLETHFLKIFVDGLQAGDLTKSTRLTLQQLDKGIHRIRVELVDETGTSLSQAKSVSFEFRDAVEITNPAPEPDTAR